MNKKAFSTIIAALFTVNAQADTVGLYIGAQAWQSKASGDVDNTNTLKDLNVKNKHQVNYFIAIEHPFPFIPNARISNTTLDTSGQASSSQTSVFINNGITHTTVIDTDINARFNVSYVDYTLYYEFIDNNLLSFDLGLSARDFNGDISVKLASTSFNTWQDIFGNPYEATSDTQLTKTINTDDIEPMLYIATTANIPLTGLSAFVQADYALTSDESIYNYKVGLNYTLVDTMAMDFSLNLGYQMVVMEFENSEDVSADLEFKGAFVGATLHF